MAKNITAQKAWTAEDDQFLKANYKKLSATEIANQMDRSRSSINSRVYTLGLNDHKKDKVQKTAIDEITIFLIKLKRDHDRKIKEVETMREKILTMEEALNIVKEADLSK